MSKRTFKFRLYVAGGAQNSALAISNLTAFCHKHLPDRHQVEIVDVMRDPRRALLESIFLTPTLVKFAPGPIQRIIGTLNDPTIVLQALGLETVAA